ncbi:CoA transferase, partial [Staphylococcus aureus]|uniref:CoA transferase n=2 Tax=Bacillales TaxID=1385 RepID=UPI003F9C3AA6
FIELVKKADVLVENFSLGAMERLGLGYDVLSEINPRLIYASGKGYGLDGPYAARPAMDLTVQAMGGVMA